MNSLSGALLAAATLLAANASPAWAGTQESAAPERPASDSQESVAPPDEVTLKDGSVIKGTIASIENDKIYLASEYFDPITIDVWDVRSVTTGGVVDVVVDSGEVWRGRISANAQGEMVFEPEAGGAARPLNFGFVDGVYQLRSVWANKLTFGVSDISGNADVIGVSLSAAGVRDSERHRFTWDAKFNYAEAEGRELAQNWSGLAKYDYFLRPRTYLAATEDLRHDKFADLRVRSVTSGSLGFVLLRRPEALLEVEFGAGVLVERFFEDTGVNDFAGRVSAYYRMPIGTKVELSNRVVVHLSNGADHTHITNDFVLKIEFTRRWGLEIANAVYYDSNPSVFATDSSDVQTTIGIAYKF